jgi:hypothetical protein
VKEQDEETIEFRLNIPLHLHRFVREAAGIERRTTHNQYLKIIEDWCKSSVFF